MEITPCSVVMYGKFRRDFTGNRTFFVPSPRKVSAFLFAKYPSRTKLACRQACVSVFRHCFPVVSWLADGRLLVWPGSSSSLRQPAPPGHRRELHKRRLYLLTFISSNILECRGKGGGFAAHGGRERATGSNFTRGSPARRRNS